VITGQVAVVVTLLDQRASSQRRPEAPIRIIATATDQAITVEVADRGPGLPAGEEE